jgi:hypothetical protein
MTVPSGTPVTFTATATDAVDGTDAVTCVPASGATFPVGHTTVTCTAHDAAGNQAASQTLNVFVTSLPSLTVAVNSLLDIAHVIEGFGLNHSVRDDLYDQLIAVATGVYNGDAVATCQAFDGFTVSANAQLTAGQFASLTPSINAARTTLGC